MIAPRLGIVVVTHESADVVDACLRALAHHEPDATIVVVDDASPSGPPTLPQGGHLVVQPENRGFGAACNAGAAWLHATGPVDAIAFLNPDVTLHAASLTALAGHVADGERLGVVTGPITHPDGSPQANAWGPTSVVRAAWFASGLQLPRLRRVVGRVLSSGLATSSASMAGEIAEVDGHVLGGAMVVDAGCFAEIDGFDEDFFLYWEDADLCARARDAGWRVAVVDVAPMVHAAGTSSAGIGSEQRWRWYRDGADTFATKHLDDVARRRLLRALDVGRRLRRRAA